MTIAIYCAGGLGKELLGVVRQNSRWDSIIFVDDIMVSGEYKGHKVVPFNELKGQEDTVEFIIANGEPNAREALYNKVTEAGFGMATLYGDGIFPGAKIGKGCILLNCLVSDDCVIEDNVYINSPVTIGHDSVVGAHSVISPFVFVGGKTIIGKKVYIAAGAMIKDRIKIADDSIIGMGAVIMRNVKSKAIMIGNPAKKIGENSGGVFGMFD